MQQIKIIGSYLSPYVRKVLVCLDIKGLDYQIDPVIPFYGNDEFSRISPVRRIPVFIDQDITLCDSTVICEYLDERYPGLNLLPKTPVQRAKGRWLEEFADTRMGEVFIWHFYNQRVIKRFVWNEPIDEYVVSNALNYEIPQVLDYLESQLPGQGYLFGALSVADISLASFFRNGEFAGFSIDATRWPITASFVARVLEHPGFIKLNRYESLLLRTPITRHRQALQEAGAPLAAESFASSEPRRGILSI